MSTQAEQIAAFEYTQLADVDPTFKPVDQDIYTLEIVKAWVHEYALKADSAAVTKGTGSVGEMANMYKFKYQIVDDPKFAGRTIEVAYFISDFTKKGFRRLMDGTGVRQEPGQSISEWLKKFESLSPRAKFKTLVTVKAGRKEGDQDNNEVSLKDVQPAN